MLELKETKNVFFDAHFKSLKELIGLTKLEKLVLYDSVIETLEGIENFAELKHLEIIRGKYLDDISALKNGLEEIKFYECKRINDFSRLKHLESLTCIELEYCSSIPNVDFIIPLKNLKRFNFYGTLILNEDLSPIF